RREARFAPRQQLVERIDLGEELRLARRGVQTARRQEPRRPLADRGQLRDESVAFAPVIDGVAEGLPPGEPGIEASKSADVAWIVLAGKEAGIDFRRVGMRLLELLTRDAIAHRDGDGAMERLEKARVAGRHIAMQADDRIFLRLGIGALAG